jgi:hypothetical protein
MILEVNPTLLEHYDLFGLFARLLRALIGNALPIFRNDERAVLCLYHLLRGRLLVVVVVPLLVLH